MIYAMLYVVLYGKTVCAFHGLLEASQKQSPAFQGQGILLFLLLKREQYQNSPVKFHCLIASQYITNIYIYITESHLPLYQAVCFASIA